jgi:hypothetical protein
MTPPFFLVLVRLWYILPLALVSLPCSDLMMMSVPRYLFFPHSHTHPAFCLLSVSSRPSVSLRHARKLSILISRSFFTQIDRLNTHTSLSLFSFPSHSPVRLPTLAFLPPNCCLIATLSTHTYTRTHVHNTYRHGTAEKHGNKCSRYSTCLRRLQWLGLGLCIPPTTIIHTHIESYSHTIRHRSIYPLPSILFIFHHRCRIHYGHYNYPDSFCLYRCQPRIPLLT